jgi:hypothetical protein
LHVRLAASPLRAVRNPYEAIAEDAASPDDALGEQHGQVVRSDSVMVEHIAALPAEYEPSAVTERVAWRYV